MEPIQNVRPNVTVFDASTGKAMTKPVPLPSVFQAPIRSDVVQFVFFNINKNKRQPHGVSPMAGHQTSAVSWGTGRAVARVSRVSGSGTGRSGQGAYGNHCRKGHMFSPKVTWRRWARKVPTTMKRHAVASAIAASAVPALVQARGHHIGKLAEVPLVVDNEAFDKIAKTKEAVSFLKRFGVYDDVLRVALSRRLRNGKGKMRNRRYKQRRGPVIVFKDKSSIVHAFRNIPGVDLMCVKRLNLLKLAPGGHMGRLVIWTSDAFKYLEKLFGGYTKNSKVKNGYSLIRPTMNNSDLNSIINSDAVQCRLNPKKRNAVAHPKLNPFKNVRAMMKLNPQVIADRKVERKNNEENRLKKKQLLETKLARKKALKEGKKTPKPAKPMGDAEYKKKRKETKKKREKMLKRKRLYVKTLLDF